MKKEYIMMTLLIIEDPCTSIDVYLQPLVDKLKELWENGVPTYNKLKELRMPRLRKMCLIHWSELYSTLREK